jgi:hypothetical protein
VDHGNPAIAGLHCRQPEALRPRLATGLLLARADYAPRFFVTQSSSEQGLSPNRDEWFNLIRLLQCFGVKISDRRSSE